MAVTVIVGFETQLGTSNAEGSDFAGLTGTASISTAQARTGAASLRCNPASGASGYGTVSQANYTHFGLYVATKPSLDRVVFGIIAVGFIHLKLTSAGALAVYLNTTLIGTSAAAFASPGWHWVGVRQVTGTSVAFLRIDGVDEVTGTATVSGTNSRIGFVDTEASAADIYVDDVITDNATFLAPSKVDLLLPISDNTVTGVTDANGATTNLWQAVDNTPPVGVASANEAANPKASIKFPASATETYTANLETYSTAGILSGDTVLAVQSLIRHGEDIATGTKNGTLGAVSNPTISDSLAFTFGTDGGAHGAETAGLWITKRGTLTLSPSVTLGTSPTLTITRASESRVGCVDLMGLYVAWTPAAVVDRVPYFTPMPQLIAQ